MIISILKQCKEFIKRKILSQSENSNLDLFYLSSLFQFTKVCDNICRNRDNFQLDSVS